MIPEYVPLDAERVGIGLGTQVDLCGHGEVAALDGVLECSQVSSDGSIGNAKVMRSPDTYKHGLAIVVRLW